MAYGEDGLGQRTLLPDTIVSNALVSFVYDETSDAGPLTGIQAGLQNSPFEYNLIVASDMPFVRWDIAERLFQVCARESADAAIPVWEGRRHPLFAVYRQSVMFPLTTYRSSGGRKVMEWLNHLRLAEVTDHELRCIDPQGVSFMNMNTPWDYEIACQKAQRLDR
jgi:molybdopterin-guanine dinucleotide biosynthesis protein A